MRNFSLESIFTIVFCLFTSHFAVAQTYEDMPAQRKLDLLWQRIQETEYNRPNPIHYNYGTIAIGAANPHHLQGAITNSSDFFKKKRKKVTHARGSVASVEFIPSPNSPYSGIWQTGAIGLVRLSHTLPFINTPSVALKFFIDGHPSVNILTMGTLDPVVENNFFAIPATNKLADPKFIPFKILPAIFKQALILANSKHLDPLHLPLDHIGQKDQFGTEVDNPASPFQIWLESDIHLDQSLKDYRESLSEISPDKLLFKVFAKANGKPKLQIGEIRLTSRFIASKFGDERLFFKHYVPTGK